MHENNGEPGVIWCSALRTLTALSLYVLCLVCVAIDSWSCQSVCGSWWHWLVSWLVRRKRGHQDALVSWVASARLCLLRHIVADVALC